MAAVTDNERFRILLRSYPVEALELLYDLYYNTLLRIAWKLMNIPDPIDPPFRELFDPGIPEMV